MSVKCAVCGKAIVSKRGQVCIACQVKQNSMQGNLNSSGTQEITGTGQQNLQEAQQSLYTQAPQPAKKKNAAREYRGTVHNFQRTEIKKSILQKWLHAFLYGVPYSKSNIQYEFTLYEGDGMTAGINGHEVVMYGDAGYTLLSDNSIVRVKGKRDKNGVVMASEIIGVNTGFHLRPKAAVSPQIVRILTIACIVLLAAGIFSLTGLHPASTADTTARTTSQQTTQTASQQTTNIPSRQTTQSAAQQTTNTTAQQTTNTAVQSTNAVTGNTGRLKIESVLIAVIAFLAAALLLKTQIQKRWSYSAMLILFGLGMFSKVFLALFALAVAYLLLRGKKEK